MSRRDSTNVAAIDGLTVAHFSAGAAWGILGLPPALGLGVAVAWEVFEVWLSKRVREDSMWSRESNPNMLADVLVAAAGYLVARGVAVVRA